MGAQGPPVPRSFAASHMWTAARVLRPLRVPVAAVCCAAVVAPRDSRPQPARCSWLWPTPQEILGWKRKRSVLGRLIVPDADLSRIATLMNTLVDLEGYSEEDEQFLFEHCVAVCVELIAPRVPPPLYELLHTDHEPLEDGEARSDFTDAIRNCCMDKCYFPFLDEQDKRRVIRCIAFVLAECMCKKMTLAEYTSRFDDPDEQETIVVNVFIAGAMDVFFDDEVREEMENELTEMVPEIPFVPVPFILKVIRAMVEVLKDCLDESLHECYHEFVEAQDKGIQLSFAPPGLKKDKKRLKEIADTYKDKPFTLQLRRVVIENMIKGNKGNRPLPIIRDAWRSRAYGWLVDIVFSHIPGLSKMEQSILRDPDRARPKGLNPLKK